MGDLPSAGVEVEEGGGILLGFLFCKVLVGTGFSSLQLAKASSTKLTCSSGKGGVQDFRLTLLHAATPKTRSSLENQANCTSPLTDSPGAPRWKHTLLKEWVFFFKRLHEFMD